MAKDDLVKITVAQRLEYVGIANLALEKGLIDESNWLRIVKGLYEHDHPDTYQKPQAKEKAPEAPDLEE